MTSQEDNIVIPDILAFDIGNTSLSMACVQADEVTHMQTLKLDNLDQLDAKVRELWAELEAPRKVVASSVNQAGLTAVESAVKAALGEESLVIGRDLPLPIQTTLPHPQSIGTDRLCAAAAAFDRLQTACVVADFGSAITVDYIDTEGVFQGGAIMPGLGMSARSLQEKTAQLPQVELRAPDWVFGNDTEQAIIGGIVFGARGALRELVESYATEKGQWPLVILTGGDAQLVCPHPGESGLVQAIVEDLVLRGVALAYYRTLVK